MRQSSVAMLAAACGSIILAGAWAAMSQSVPKPGAHTASSSQSSASANYQIDWRSTNGGGAIHATSPNYDMGMSVGQSVTGATRSAADTMGIGFWYGDCYCMCHGDPNCDGVHNVQDVVLAVNVAFRGYPPITDPTLSCPRERTDINCDGVTSIQDVVGLVDVAFRGVEPSVRICKSCAYGSPQS